MCESSLILKGNAKADIDLSEQFLLRCTPGSDCGGGYIEDAIDKVVKSKLPDEEKYPYSPYTYKSSQICLPSLFGETVSTKPRLSFYRISDDEIKELLLMGPLAIAVSATDWEYYSSGVWKCNSYDKINHAVLLVGWTNDAWIIKNQWGSDWGEKGYIQVSRDPRYNCKIGSAVHMLNQFTLKCVAVSLIVILAVLGL